MTGLETLGITTLAKNLSNISLPTFTAIGNTSLDGKVKYLIFHGFKKYIETYNKRHGILKVLGMRQPVSLDEVYTAVKLLSERDCLKFANVVNLEEDFRNSNKERFYFDDDKEDKKSGILVANSEQYLMVLGSPGAGKSTFLRQIGLEALKGKNGKYQHSLIPIFLELKKFNDEEINITNLIAEEFNYCGFPEWENFTQKSLQKGNLLILFDGLDEVPTANLNQVITAIENFVDKYDQNRFIASCRVAAYKSSFRRFRDVVMADFDDGQIEQFINNWFNNEEDKKAKVAEKCWQLLQEDRNKAARELAKTPLLLTFLCLSYNKLQSFPPNRSELYSKALRILLEEWAAEKRIKKDDIYEGLHTQLEEILLSEIAYHSFIEDNLFFHQKDIVKEIKTFLAGNLNAPQYLDGEKVLNAIAIQQGILVERAENIYLKMQKEDSR